MESNAIVKKEKENQMLLLEMRLHTFTYCIHCLIKIIFSRSAIAVKAPCPLSAVVYIARRCIKTGYKPRGVSSKVKRLVSWFLSTKQHAVCVFSSTTSLSPRSIKNLSDHPKAELQRSSPSSGFISNRKFLFTPKGLYRSQFHRLRSNQVNMHSNLDLRLGIEFD